LLLFLSKTTPTQPTMLSAADQRISDAMAAEARAVKAALLLAGGGAAGQRPCARAESGATPAHK
jgi:hypothetical protein